jgi:hypothetical protein
MKLSNYQITLLESLKIDRFSLIKHSRQMGVSTVLTEFIIELLLTNENNNIIIICEKLSSSKHLLNKIRIDNRLFDLKKIKNNTRRLDYENGNSIRIISNLDGLRGHEYSHVIIDNACFINNLSDFLTTITPMLNIKKNSQLIIASNNKKGWSFFNDLFKNNDNIFKKHLIKWELNEKYDEIWYNNLKNYLSDDDIKCEYDLIEINNIKKNKDKLISFRLDDQTYDELIKNLLIKDISLSEYLRFLIKNDNNEK